MARDRETAVHASGNPGTQCRCKKPPHCTSPLCFFVGLSGGCSVCVCENVYYNAKQGARARDWGVRVRSSAIYLCRGLPMPLSRTNANHACVCTCVCGALRMLRCSTTRQGGRRSILSIFLSVQASTNPPVMCVA